MSAESILARNFIYANHMQSYPDILQWTFTMGPLGYNFLLHNVL